MSKELLLLSIAPGDLVEISSRYTNFTIKGRAVMRGPHGWVINAGGRNGIPAIADVKNIVSVVKPKAVKPRKVFSGYDLGGEP